MITSTVTTHCPKHKLNLREQSVSRLGQMQLYTYCSSELLLYCTSMTKDIYSKIRKTYSIASVSVTTVLVFMQKF